MVFYVVNEYDYELCRVYYEGKKIIKIEGVLAEAAERNKNKFRMSGMWGCLPNTPETVELYFIKSGYHIKGDVITAPYEEGGVY